MFPKQNRQSRRQQRRLNIVRRLIKLVGGSARDLIFFLIFIVIALIAAAIIKDAPVIGKLSDASFARGLITFIISVATIGLAFILVFQAFASPADQQADERFRRAREVFTVLMGVLGTIVGFYFGSADKLAPLQIAPIRAAAKHITTHISGGYAPYRYSITSPDKDFKEISGTSEDGWIIENLEQATKPQSALTLEVADSKEQKATRKIDLRSDAVPGLTPGAVAPPQPSQATPGSTATNK